MTYIDKMRPLLAEMHACERLLLHWSAAKRRRERAIRAMVKETRLQVAAMVADKKWASADREISRLRHKITGMRHDAEDLELMLTIDDAETNA